MTRVWAMATFSAFALAACSFAISTSGLSGGGSEGTPDAPAGDAPADVSQSADAPTDTVAEKPPADPSLVASWSFEDAEGRTAADGSGNGHGGTLTGDVGFQADGARGRAARFVGTGHIVVPSLAGAKFPPTGTLSLWLKHGFVQDEPDDRNVLDGWDNTRQHLFFRRVGDGTANEFQIGFQPANNQYSFGTNFNPPPSKWVHVVVVWAAGAADVGEGWVFVDREQIANDRYSRDFSPLAQTLVLGDSFIGAIDEVKLFSRAFSPAEARALE